MSDDFRALPSPQTQGVLGSGLEMTCEPPEGAPDPVVRWKKNGRFIDFTAAPNRVSITYNGHLRISKLLLDDEGRYQCVASNMAAVRDSNPINLHILSKFIITTFISIIFHNCYALISKSITMAP